MTDRPNVLVLVFDTLRPDVLGCYGGGVATPAIDSIAERGTRFDRAYAAGPGTPISHAALFSGQYPSETGVIGSRISIPEDVPLLAEWFRDRGYDTLGIPGPAKVGADYGFDRGFEHFFETYRNIPPYRVGALPAHVRALLSSEFRGPLARHHYRLLTSGPDSETKLKFDLLERHLRDCLEAPFFAFANLLTVHMPYRIPLEYKRAETPGVDAPRWYLLQELAGFEETLTVGDPDVRPERIYEAQTTGGVAKYFADPDWLTEAELDVLRAWYRAAVRYLDDRLADFLGFLRGSGLAEDTILVVTSDHGEHFGEHDLLVHGYGLFEECLHVPLLMAGPEIPAGERVEGFTSLVDVFDTVCSQVGIERPVETSGRSVFEEGPRDAVVSEHGIRRLGEDGHGRYLSDERRVVFEAGRKGIRDEDHLYVYWSTGSEELFERPGEASIEDPPRETLADYRSQLFAEIDESFEVSTTNEGTERLSDGVERNLRELGYID